MNSLLAKVRLIQIIEASATIEYEIVSELNGSVLPWNSFPVSLERLWLLLRQPGSHTLNTAEQPIAVTHRAEDLTLRLPQPWAKRLFRHAPRIGNSNEMSISFACISDVLSVLEHEGALAANGKAEATLLDVHSKASYTLSDVNEFTIEYLDVEEEYLVEQDLLHVDDDEEGLEQGGVLGMKNKRIAYDG